MSQRQLPIILALGTTQTLAWASSYYLPAILADPIAHDRNRSTGVAMHGNAKRHRYRVSDDAELAVPQPSIRNVA